MDESPKISKKIYFIFSHKGKNNLPINLDENESVKNIKIIKEENNEENSYILYTLTISSNSQEKNISLFLTFSGEKYFTSFEWLKPYSPIFVYKVEFKPFNKNIVNNLNQITLSYRKQFTIFRLYIDSQNNELFKDLCLSSIDFIHNSSLINQKQKNIVFEFDFYLYLFIGCLFISLENNDENILTKYFNEFNNDLIDVKNSFNRNDSSKFLIEDIINNNFLASLNDFRKIHDDIKSITNNNEVILVKLDLILAYYYFNYKPKKFIEFISKKNERSQEVFSHLTKNRKIFKDFSSEIMDFYIFEETEILEEIFNLLLFIPNLVELTKILTIEILYEKISYLEAIENKTFNLGKIAKPNKDDNIELLNQNINKLFKLAKENNRLVFILSSEEFFMKYSEIFYLENLKNLEIIIDIFSCYNSLLGKIDNATEEELYNSYNDTGIHLIKCGKITNRDVLKFVEKIYRFFKGKIIFPEEIYKAIVPTNDILFINEFLNGEISLGDNFILFVKGFFNNFKTLKEFNNLIKWNKNYCRDEEVYFICFETFKKFLIEGKDNKLISELNKINKFLGELFIIISRKKPNFIAQLIELEQIINKPRIFLEIFAKILQLKDEPMPDSLRQHINNYIDSNFNKENVLSIYYKLLTLYDDKRVNFLLKNLTVEYAIETQDFYHFPNEVIDRILLFTKLYNDRYFNDYSEIRELEYFKKSISAKDHIKSVKYKDGINMYKNINEFRPLFLYFLPNRINEDNDYLIDIIIIDFYELFSTCKDKYEALKLILNYWKHFFSFFKKEEIFGLEQFLDKLDNTPIEDFNKLESEMNSFLTYENENEAKTNDKLFNSFFFMGLYQDNSINEELAKFQYTLMRFEELRSLGANPIIDLLSFDLLNKLIELVYKNRDRLDDELIFIKEYFQFDKDDNNNFDSNKIKNDFINKVNEYKNKRKLDDYQYELDDDFFLINIPSSNFSLLNNETSIKNNIKAKSDKEEGFNLFSDDEDNETNYNDNNKITEEEIIQKEIDKINQEENKKKELLKDINQMSYDYFYFYRINNSSDNYLQENFKFEDIFLNFFWESFKNIRKYEDLTNSEFYKDIICLMSRIFLTSVSDNYFKKEESIKNIKLCLIYEFFDILEFYKKYNIISKKPFIYELMEKLIQCKEMSNDENINIVRSFDNLFESIKEKIKDQSLNNLFIKILAQVKIINDNEEFNTPLLDLLFRKENKALLNYSVPLLDKIFKEEIETKVNIEIEREGVDFEWNNYYKIEKHYKETKDKDLEELILYYFESKLTLIFDKYKNEFDEKDIYQNERMKQYLIQSINILEKDSRKENYKNISLLTKLFCISFIKCFLNNYINYLYNHNQDLGDVSDININIIEGQSINPFRTSLKLYVLKLFFRILGNYNEFSKFNINNYQIPYFENKDIKKIKEENKDYNFDINKQDKYGFDYLFIKFSTNEFNEFINIENNLIELGKNGLNEIISNSLISLVNNCFNLDSFICALINVFLSHFQNTDFFKTNEYKNIDNWMYDSLNNNKFSKINNYSKNLLLLFIDLNNYNNKIIKIGDNATYGSLSYSYLLSLLFSLRFVFNTLLYSNQNYLYYQIVINGKNIFNKYNKYFDYYNKDFDTYEKRKINNLTFSIIRFVLYSHLYFGYLLGNIDLNDINSYFFNNNNEFRMLNLIEQEFDFIRKIISLLGIENIIVFMNYIFNDIIPIFIYIETKFDEEYIYSIEDKIKTKIEKYCNNFDMFYEKYNAQIKQINNNDYKNEFKRIMLEDTELYNDRNINNKYSFISYLTITNFSSINDFESQFKYLINDKNSYPMINCILNDSEIIKLSKNLPYINSFINEVNNELILKIRREDVDKEIKEFNFSIDNFDEKMEKFNNKIKEIKKLKSFSTIEISEISRKSKISEIINIKDNSIYKLFDTIINVYNQFLTNTKIFNDNKNFIESIILQNASKNDYINFYYNNDNEEISPNEKLQEIISLYSKRNRYNNNAINTYNGSKIIYDFNQIESLLQKEYLYGKRPFHKNQRTFIFSNEIFSEEKNLIVSINNKYPQKEIDDKIIKNDVDKFFNDENITKDNYLQIYINIQYILFYLMTYDCNNYDGEKISLEYISKIMKKANYQFNELFIDFLDKYKQNLNLNNLLYLLKNIEIKCFEYLTEEISNDIKDNKINIYINREKNNEIIEYYKNEKLLINEDIMINSIKRYILRYYIPDNQNKNDFLNAVQLEKILKKSDIWDDNIYKDEKFKNESDTILKLNNENNCLMKYFFNKLFEKKNENRNEIKSEIKEEESKKKIRKKRKMQY